MPGNADYERLKALLTDFDVVFSEGVGAITIEAQTGPKNKGYTGFVAIFSFEEDGSFSDVGLWE